MNSMKSNIQKLDKKSEEIKKLSNSIRITSQREISQLHAGKKMSLTKMRNEIKKLKSKIKDPLVMAVNKSAVFIAFQEYAEAEFISALSNEKPLPSLEIPENCYFTGLCDSIGEEKRLFMVHLIKGRDKKALKLLDACLSLGTKIAEIDASPAVIQGLKPKKDLVRRSIEHMLEMAARLRIR